ncbi:MAG: hypothetical protein CME06_17315 [Gemmatimonadetes bacterium]|nr:hypothetical protein [Gemmatimonadota bacterium]
MALQADFRDLLEVFDEEGVEYLLIGGYAVAFHARPRMTKDLDLWIAASATNRSRVERALVRFGAPSKIIETFRGAAIDEIVYIGSPPVRVDLLQQIPGIEFEEAYGRRLAGQWEGVPVSVISREDLIRAKRAAGRPQDLLDAEILEKLG